MTPPITQSTAPRRTLTVEEAGQLLGIGRSLAFEAARRGDIPTIRIGRRLLVPRQALMAMLGESDVGHDGMTGRTRPVSELADTDSEADST